MEDSLYDEFGNYIGPELRSSDEEGSLSDQDTRDTNANASEMQDDDNVRLQLFCVAAKF